MAGSLILPLIFSLTVLGLVMVGSSSTVTAVRDFGNQWYYLKLQAVWAALGLTAFWLAYRSRLGWWEKTAHVFFIVSLILLAVVLVPGIGSQYQGARRWISIGPLVFQPSELAKLSLSLYLARLLSRARPGFWPIQIILAALCGLMLLQPDMGSALIIAAIVIAVYFGSGAPLRHIFSLFSLAIPATVLLAAISPYRWARFQTFLNSSSDPLGTSYHIRQSLLGLGSGGWFGIGLGQSRQKYFFLPETTTDSIFSIIGEELGLTGTSLVSLGFLLFALIGFRISRLAPHRFSSLLALGLTIQICVQAFINISAMSAILPITGVTLPFISYGGSSLIITLISSGLLLNIARNTRG